MSNTKGNMVDPLDAVYEYGANSLHHLLVTGVMLGWDIPLNVDKITAKTAFMNKLWNCRKFVMDNVLKVVDGEEMQTYQSIGERGL